ncbi:hypothetical protein I6F48_18425 [Pseudoalteromonas sp. SWYJ118]|uniref:hypothetical protein n=1 Tax=Pseudoalteromonas sp. SWYJ118 TaxID=2792062 RepID=UPI0018CD6607|nr:hypothetical protein [Pseudoalteromonas sp. SWYJ118]MBH0077498.1 hypothetical protein [Pseudoalteromonas sp. SWYJ118]
MKNNNKAQNRYCKLLVIETAGLSIILLMFFTILIFLLLNEYNLGNIMNNALNFLASFGSIAGGFAALYLLFCSIPNWKKDYDSKLLREKIYKTLANIDALEKLVNKQVEARQSYTASNINYNKNDSNTDKYRDLKVMYRKEISYLFNKTQERILVLGELGYYLEHLIDDKSIRLKLDSLNDAISKVHNMGCDLDNGQTVNEAYIDKANKKYILNTEIFESTKKYLKELLK